MDPKSCCSTNLVQSRPDRFASRDELILLVKRAFDMTILVVTHELQSAFRIADRLAMPEALDAVGTKEVTHNTHPRIRQFFDRQPERFPVKSRMVWFVVVAERRA
jgi:ABC-type transporter Mla maintaining outer membrane lipid asymmetry ATPase subunit MlaF